MLYAVYDNQVHRNPYKSNVDSLFIVQVSLRVLKLLTLGLDDTCTLGLLGVVRKNYLRIIWKDLFCHFVISLPLTSSPEMTRN